jgi:Phage integrase, N-terminal SAM-like domain
MNDSTREISPLHQRMLEDMRLRKLAPQTQASYVRSVRRLAGYLRRPPDTATVEDLRNFRLCLEWAAYFGVRAKRHRSDGDPFSRVFSDWNYGTVRREALCIRILH